MSSTNQTREFHAVIASLERLPSEDLWSITLHYLGDDKIQKGESTTEARVRIAESRFTIDSSLKDRVLSEFSVNDVSQVINEIVAVTHGLEKDKPYLANIRKYSG